MATGKYDLSSKTTLEFGFERMVQSQPSASNAWGTQVTSYYGMNISNGALTSPNVPSSFNGSATTTTVWFGGNYKVSDKLSLDSAYYNINNGFNSALNGQQYTIQAFSLMAVYKFDKPINFGGVPLNSDVYAGLMTLGYSGPFIAQKETALNIGLATRNTIFGTGVRVRF
jgi:predicted porin